MTASLEDLAASRDQAQARFDAAFVGDDPSVDILDLAAVWQLDTSAVAATTSIHWPFEYFEHATPAVRDALLSRIQSAQEDPYWSLQRLAHVGDASVVQQIVTWTQSPPDWLTELDVSVETCLHEAGWELRGSRRRELTLSVALPLRRTKSTSKARAIIAPSDETCPRCARALFTAVHLDNASAFDLPGEVTIRLCIACVQRSQVDTQSPSGQMLAHFDLAGHSSLDVGIAAEPVDTDAVMVAWEVDPEAYPSRWRAASRTAPVPVLGGLPSWEQDAAYATCPECARTMRHLAQIPLGSLVEGDRRGSIYIQVCTDCRVASGSFQRS